MAFPLGNFNPRAPCGARQPPPTVWVILSIFQSTRPVWGATVTAHFSRVFLEFQSTRPVWGATLYVHANAGGAGISIHAPRVGRDQIPWTRCPPGWSQFQSTRPVWGATRRMEHEKKTLQISIHAPRVGATANLTILPRQICTKGTKEFLLGRKTHGKKEK